MELLFEDNHLLVLNKPAGLLTQPSGTQQDSLEQQAKIWLKYTYEKPGNVFLEAVHRLDRPVSGVVVFGKTSKAVKRLNAFMRLKQMRKTYWAWVEGSLTSEKGHLEHCLVHDDFHAKIVDVGHPQGKMASLTYSVLKRRQGATLLEIEIATGRYHQIRLQLATLGHPIWGDRKYGAQHTYVPQAIALHHRRFQCPHPISQTWMTFEAAPSSAFTAIEDGFVS